MSDREATRSNPKLRIIDATIRCIGEFGIQGTTTRRIADLAGVNYALVNYHFGSKDRLIDLAMRRSLDDYMSAFAGATASRRDQRDLLYRILTTVLDDAVSKPRVLRSYLYDALIKEDYHGVFIEKLNGVLGTVEHGLDNLERAKDIRKARMAIVQMLAATLFIGLMPEFFRGFLDLDLRMPAAQKEFTKSLIDHYCDELQSKKIFASGDKASRSSSKANKARAGTSRKHAPG